MRRREFITLVSGATVAWPSVLRAQKPGVLRNVGLLMVYEEGKPQVQAWLAAFREALGKLGWTEGQNIHFEFRWAGIDLNRIQQAAKELIALRPT